MKIWDFVYLSLWGLTLGEYLDLRFRMVEERVMELCWGLKDGLISYLIAIWLKKMWGFRF